jgi:hypothetical protein
VVERAEAPQPDPWWWIVGLAGAVGGTVSATVFAPVIGEAGFFGGVVTAFSGGVLVGSIVDGIGGITNKGV